MAASLQCHGWRNGGARLLLPDAVAEPAHDCSALEERRGLTTAGVGKAPARASGPRVAKAFIASVDERTRKEIVSFDSWSRLKGSRDSLKMRPYTSRLRLTIATVSKREGAIVGGSIVALGGGSEGRPPFAVAQDVRERRLFNPRRRRRTWPPRPHGRSLDRTKDSSPPWATLNDPLRVMGRRNP